MLKKEIAKFSNLNKIARTGGTVILGSQCDTQIPLGELVDAFDINTNVYNRSASNLSVTEAADYYDAVVKPLYPERIILHLGDSDIDFFKEHTEGFDHAYRMLIQHIREDNKRCIVGIVSLHNPEQDPTIGRLNRHLRMLAESEHCEFEDISLPRVWNPVETRNAMAFASSMGLSRRFRNHKSLYDLAKIFFCFSLDCN